MLLCERLIVKLNGLLVAPGMLVNPLPLLACHCTVGAGKPLADALKLATLPAQTVRFAGFAVTLGGPLV